MKAAAGRSALLVVDMINPMEFPGADSLLRQTLPMLPVLARLKKRLKARGIPAIYVNDNFTHWLSDFRELVAICSQPDSPGAPLAQALPPEYDDYLVLKPKHSAFLGTPLEILLSQLGVRHVVVTGIAGDGCVLTTAADAHMRDFDVSVPTDCCASITRARNQRALRLLRESMHLDTRAARQL
ncbi:MAG TPA: isochorismatase family cysteine hydrolase [Luteimonas sp.]|nr:isochorismatase family cysteine hydrolase [Luteimonas sp.]